MAGVFIGIPTINRPEFVRHSIRSVLEQSYRDFEVVVSDNCSEPGVAESIKSFIEQCDDERIRFHQQQENVGEYGQGRYFLAAAEQSKYFMILHDDDMLCENYLQKAIECLEMSIDSAFFIADAYTIDENGDRSESVRRKYIKDHGRDKVAQGAIPVIDNQMKYGFFLISGTLFRTETLKASGFVDPEGVGNFPFETDIFLHLGDLDAHAWYQKETLLAVRFHSTSMRHYIKMLDNEKTVNALIRIFACRNYSGYAERQRKAILCKLHRAKALIAARQGKVEECRRCIRKCFAYNIFSLKLWLVAPIALLAPGLFNWILPELPVTREAPLLRREN